MLKVKYKVGNCPITKQDSSIVTLKINKRCNATSHQAHEFLSKCLLCKNLFLPQCSQSSISLTFSFSLSYFLSAISSRRYCLATLREMFFCCGGTSLVDTILFSGLTKKNTTIRLLATFSFDEFMSFPIL